MFRCSLPRNRRVVAPLPPIRTQEKSISSNGITAVCMVEKCDCTTMTSPALRDDCRYEELGAQIDDGVSIVVTALR